MAEPGFSFGQLVPSVCSQTLTVLPQVWATDLMAPNLSWTLESPMPALNSKYTDVCALGQPEYFNSVRVCAHCN